MNSTTNVHSFSHERGFTLVELMVVLTVAAILLALAAPSFSDMIMNNRQTVTINELIGDLNLARSEAIKRRQQVLVCPRAGNTCSTSASPTWDQGWIVFADLDDDEALGASDSILRRREIGHQGFTVRASSAASVQYLPSGALHPGTNQTFNFCDARGATHARALVLGASGRARLSDTATCS